MSNAIGGAEASSAESAVDSMPFAAFEPSGLGVPSAVFVRDKGSDAGAAIEFDFDTQWGPVAVEEVSPEVDAKTWPDQVDAAVSMNGGPYTHGTATKVSIRNGHEGLLLVSEDQSESEVQWYETDQMEVYFYGSQLPSDVALKLVDGL